MLSVVMLSAVILSGVGVSVVIAECRFTVSHFDKCHGAPSRGFRGIKMPSGALSGFLDLHWASMAHTSHDGANWQLKGLLELAVAFWVLQEPFRA
jgi:hypothetical protein